jgi:hypothetical protein
MAAGLDVEHSDDLPAGRRHQRPARAAREQRGAFVDVDRWLGHDPVAFGICAYPAWSST